MTHIRFLGGPNQIPLGHTGFLAHNKAWPYSKGSQGGPIRSELQEGVPLILMDPRNPALVAPGGTRRDRGHFIYPPLTQILKNIPVNQTDQPEKVDRPEKMDKLETFRQKMFFFVITDR